MPLHPAIAETTRRIIDRSRDSRHAYLSRIDAAVRPGSRRRESSCGNQAHAFAASNRADKADLRAGDKPNLGIVSAYNDMLSAHQPYENHPALIRRLAREAGATAQMAGGVPAMCDGITQGREGMELSLFSREVIAMSAAVALSHDMFDGALFLGVCDKIVPGLLIAALSFGHLPAVFVPAGPMPSGLPNLDKAAVRRRFAAGEAGHDDLMDAEAASYHAPGTCTFYGTANSNQMLMEIMGLHLPGASFINPGTPLRDALTAAAVQRAAAMTHLGDAYTPIGRVLDERSFVNGIVGLNATGGSTNHLMHLTAMAAAAGIRITLEDFDAISRAVPLMARVYPNGYADINHFHAAGGMPFVIGSLLDAGLLHAEVDTVWGPGLDAYRRTPVLDDTGRLTWEDVGPSDNTHILRPADAPFSPDGGLRVLTGNLGRAVSKVSAVADAHRVIEAPAAVFSDQLDVIDAFRRGELERDCVVVVRFQGPRAIGMPELHRLSPTLALIQERGHQVALVTDGRMSGASGKVPSAIHVTPEARDGGPLARLRDGDIVRLDTVTGTLEARVDPATWHTREPAVADLDDHARGCGRELFARFREAAGGAADGASVFDFFHATADPGTSATTSSRPTVSTP